MTEEQRKFIEDNIDLIENSEWDEFFKSAPMGTGGVLYDAGINFMSALGYVPNSSFYGSEVQTVVIPDGVTSIGNSAFSSCISLTSITIPDSVTSIGVSAFSWCTSLTSITIPNSVTSISDTAFYKCTSLKSVTIENGVMSIGYGVFMDCTNLMSVTIPNSVTSIIGDAFYNCGNIEINYDGTVSEWKNLIVSNGKFFSRSTYTCNCTDGIVKKSR